MFDSGNKKHFYKTGAFFIRLKVDFATKSIKLTSFSKLMFSKLSTLNLKMFNFWVDIDRFLVRFSFVFGKKTRFCVCVQWNENVCSEIETNLHFHVVIWNFLKNLQAAKLLIGRSRSLYDERRYTAEHAFEYGLICRLHSFAE